MFPHIANLGQLLAHIADKPEIRIIEHSGKMAGYKTACYMISGKDTFDNEWGRECRGITFYPDGRIASRSMHKFFNIGERAETQEHVLDFNDVETIMNKRDGSMIHPVPTIDGNGYMMKSKKSFESDVAIAAQSHACSNQAIDAFTLYCVQNDLTPTYEFTSPRHRIVLNYNCDDMKLLHVRRNITGEYFTRQEIYDLIASDVWYSSQIKDCIVRGSSWRTVEVVDVIEKSYQEIRSSLDDTTDIEGYVIKFNSGEMVKLKTPWYLSLHHNVTFTTQRQVAEMVLNETVDDYKSYLTMVGASYESVLEIENRVVNALDNIEHHVVSMYNHLKTEYGEDRKSWAASANKHEYFKLIMDMFSGKEVDYKAFYARNYLKTDFTLEQV